MASSNRDERQLMRQRGAGSRAVKNIDFGFSFAAQGSRDDRQLMRQRGAGNRKIDNVNFGFSFPTPSSSRRSSSRESRAARRSAGRLSNTPSRHMGKYSPIARPEQSNSTDSSKPLSDQRRRSQTPQPMVRPEQPNSSKRRRTSKYAGIPEISSAIESLESPHQKHRNITFTIAGDNTQDDSVPRQQPPTPRIDIPLRDQGTREESPLFFPEHDDKENDSASAKRIGVRFNEERRRSGVNGSIRTLRKSPVPDPTQSVVSSIETAEAEQLAEADDPQSAEALLLTEVQRTATADLSSVNGIIDSNAKSSKKRKKRKSVVLVRKKRRSSEGPRSSILRTQTEETIPEQAAEDVDIDESTVEEQPGFNVDEGLPEPEYTIDDAPELSLIQRRTSGENRRTGRRTRLSVSTSPAPREPGDEEGDETYVDDQSTPEPPTPGPKRKAKSARRRRRTSQESAGTASKGKASESSVPILTHRMTNLEALPTIVEENEDSDDPQEVSEMPATFPGRAQPNAVDVLAQICRETIEGTVAKVENMSGSTTSRAEIRRKRTALEAFAEGLDSRLFEMSQAVENRITLEARVRKSKRELAELQARWIEVRRQRDDVALKADAVRRQNWDNEEHGKTRWEISELAQRTELELHREATEEDDLEFLLNNVASNVSSAQGRSGLLDKVKLFNAQLERLAMALERR